MPPSDRGTSQMSFQLTRGLAEFGYPDHYAVLGLEVDASAGDIRKRYMKLARLLHPDSSGEMDKAVASQVLSKWVNPAYQVLSQEKERTDYCLLLKLVGQRANLEYDTSRLAFTSSQDLLKAEDYETFYQSTHQSLVESQYLQLDRSVDLVEQISELNLVFLLRRENVRSYPGGQSTNPGSANNIVAEPISADASIEVNMKEPTDKKSSSASTSDDYVKQYIRRADELIAKNLFAAAVQELRDALKLDPQNSHCHGLMGMVYLKQNQPKMAKVHLTQALKLDPQNAMALEGMNKLKKLEAQAAKAGQPMAKATQTGAKTTERRGLFGLFGGKK
jgi:curved DNA-binding protein CbpA